MNNIPDGYYQLRKFTEKQNIMTEKIKINGKSFELDITRATELGVLKPEFTITAGDKFKNSETGQIVYVVESYDSKWHLGGLYGNPFMLFSTQNGVTKDEMIKWLQKHYVKIS